MTKHASPRKFSSKPQILATNTPSISQRRGVGLKPEGRTVSAQTLVPLQNLIAKGVVTHGSQFPLSTKYCTSLLAHVEIPT